jgi:hypothetical protein
MVQAQVVNLQGPDLNQQKKKKIMFKTMDEFSKKESQRADPI